MSHEGKVATAVRQLEAWFSGDQGGFTWGVDRSGYLRPRNWRHSFSSMRGMHRGYPRYRLAPVRSSGAACPYQRLTASIPVFGMVVSQPRPAFDSRRAIGEPPFDCESTLSRSSLKPPRIAPTSTLVRDLPLLAFRH